MTQVNIKDTEQVIQFLKEKDKQLQVVENNMVAAKTRLQMLRKDYSDKMASLKEQGINSVEELDEMILTMSTELETMLLEIDKELPVDLAERFKELREDEVLDNRELLGIDDIADF